MKVRQKAICNAKIYTGGGTFCQALLIEGGRIVMAGASREILDAAGTGAEKIDAAGSLVLPAFNDSHLHLLWYGRRQSHFDGSGASSVEDVITLGRELIRRNNIKSGTWVQGAAVNPDLFTGEKRDPTRDDLDKISREHPVIVSRHCGHTVYCNSLALKMAGLTDSSPDVEGGTIERDPSGRLSGVLRESAHTIARKAVPPLSRAEKKDFIKTAFTHALSLGISAAGSHDSDGPDFDEILGIYRELYQEGGERLRVTMQCGISGSEEILKSYAKRGLKSGDILYNDAARGPLLKMGPVKLFIDGTLGGHTARMRHPYRDKTGARGIKMMESEAFERLVLQAQAFNLQTITHAIGDAAIGTVISALEKAALRENKNHPQTANRLRHGIVHCQITTPQDLERIAKGHILLFVQPVFLADDLHILESRVGPKLAASSYAWGSMETLGIPASYSTDAPVCPLNPLLNIAWAVLRRQSGGGAEAGEKSFNPAERVTVQTAVDASTAAAAYSAFSEQYAGRITPGFFADLAFIDRDIFTIPPDGICNAKVIRTMLAGETVWENAPA
ncbi:MAG: amidohydrolase [Treponema sp.]|jgi:predicted amidohydrolase YtcJ|nr:amidohydrolase [Treponema sp.]